MTAEFEKQIIVKPEVGEAERFDAEIDDDAMKSWVESRQAPRGFGVKQDRHTGRGYYPRSYSYGPKRYGWTVGFTAAGGRGETSGNVNQRGRRPVEKGEIEEGLQEYYQLRDEEGL